MGWGRGPITHPLPTPIIILQTPTHYQNPVSTLGCEGEGRRALETGIWIPGILFHGRVTLGNSLHLCLHSGDSYASPIQL